MAGLSFGALYAGSAYLVQSGNAYHGHLLATVTSGVLALAMGNRWRKTGNPSAHRQTIHSTTSHSSFSLT